MCRTRAALAPDQLSHVYLRDGEEPEDRFTYEQLDRSARAVAAELARHVSPGDRALLHYPPGIDFLIGFFGCLYAGVIAVPTAPVDGSQSEAATRARAVVRNATPRVLLSSARFIESHAAQLREVTGDSKMVPVATDTIDPASAGDWRDPGVEAGTVAHLQYSSGSTGEPKGVVLTHRQVLYNLSIMEDLVTLRTSEGMVSWLPMFHDMGLLSGGILPIFTGRPATIMSPAAFVRRPYRWLAAFSRSDNVVGVGPNFALDLCVRRINDEQRARLDLSGLHTLVIGAEPVRAATLERFTDAFVSSGLRPEALRPCFGLAEATLLVSGGPGGNPPVLRQVATQALARAEVAPPSIPGQETQTLVGCGEINSKLRVVIADPESPRPCAPGQVGEILVSGESVGNGYWDNPEATAKAFGQKVDGFDGAFLRTGDLGAMVDGELFVTGRRKDLIVIDGANHYPTDLESTVELADPAVRAGYCAVVSVDNGGQELVVVLAELAAPALRVADAAGHPRTRTAVRRALSARHGVPVHDVVLLSPGSLPFTSSGKLQRTACRTGYLEGRFERSRVDTAKRALS
jgi:acyl-CoA synthetase (AMP-forming)/AMP-acid ligase II